MRMKYQKYELVIPRYMRLMKCQLFHITELTYNVRTEVEGSEGLFFTENDSDGILIFTSKCFLKC